MGAEITNQTRLERHRHYSGPEFLREGFRPLFFLAGLWAALSVPLWIGIWSGAISYPGLGDATMWHVHEMMFGYVGAALGGFILTAVPNWTGRPPVRGWPLGALAFILALRPDCCLVGRHSRNSANGGRRSCLSGSSLGSCR